MDASNDLKLIEEKLTKAEEIAKRFIEEIGGKNSTVKVELEEGVLKVLIETKDDYLLIGKEGDKFEPFSHLLKRMIAKSLGEEIKIVVDVNGRLEKEIESLKAKATLIALRAKEYKTNFEMEPMSSYERMIIHSHLENVDGIKTESTGTGSNRRIIVKFSDALEEKI